MWHAVAGLGMFPFLQSNPSSLSLCAGQRLSIDRSFDRSDFYINIFLFPLFRCAFVPAQSYPSYVLLYYYNIDREARLFLLLLPWKRLNKKTFFVCLSTCTIPANCPRNESSEQVIGNTAVANESLLNFLRKAKPTYNINTILLRVMILFSRRNVFCTKIHYNSTAHIHRYNMYVYE